MCTNNTMSNNTVTKLFIVLKNCLLPNLDPTSYLNTAARCYTIIVFFSANNC